MSAKLNTYDVTRTDPVCPECKSTDIVCDFRGGFNVCVRCGTQVGDRIISEEQEWRSFDNDAGKDKNRVGMEDQLLGESAFNSIIIDGGNMSRIHNQGTKSAQDRALLQAMAEVHKMIAQLELPGNIEDRTKVLLKRVIDSGKLRGRKSQEIMISCVYLACRQMELPRMLNDLCDKLGVEKRSVQRTYLKIVKNNLQKLPNRSKRTTKTVDYIPGYCNQLDLPQSVQEAAVHICNKMTSLSIGEGKSPASLASAAIYMASQLHLTGKRSFDAISKVTHSAENTIKQTYKLIYPKRHELVSQDYASKEVIDSLPS